MNKWFVFYNSIKREKQTLHFLHWQKGSLNRDKDVYFPFQKKRIHRNIIVNKAIFNYTNPHKNGDNNWYLEILEQKAEAIKNSKNFFNKIKHTEKKENKIQPIDYTTLHLLAIELNTLLCGSIVEHITQADEKTIVLHLSKRKTTPEKKSEKEKTYYLYICYNENHPIISLGLQIKKLFNRFIDNDYAQKLNPILKYSTISNVYIKRSFIKILCIDFILKNKKDENIDLENIDQILYSENDTISSTKNNNNNDKSYTDMNKTVTLLFDLYYNSCASFVINKRNNEIIASPYNYITEKVIDKSFKEGHIYVFPNKEECKLIPNHYDFFSSFLNLFKSRKDQKFITSMIQLYEGVSYNLLLQFFKHLNISINATFRQLEKSVLLDFFNNAYVKWVRFLILKETNKNLMFYPHYDYGFNVYNSLKFLKTDRRYPQYTLNERETAQTEIGQVQKITNVEKLAEIGKGVETEKEIEIEKEVETEKRVAIGKEIDTTKSTEVKFDTIIEMLYYSYTDVLPVNQFYTALKFSKEYINKKLPIYYEMIEQYKNEKEVNEKVYLLHEHINQLTVFQHTISKMNEWIDKKTFDALKLIENELKHNSLEDNRKKYVKKIEQEKQKEEIFETKIKNVKPAAVKTAQNIFKGCMVMRINEADLSSPFLIVGKNSKQNEKISTQILKFNDLWFHVHEHPGGHVILRNKKINGHFISADTNLDDIEIDDEIKYAADIAAYFSKMRTIEKTLVCFTLGKYVRKDNSMDEGAVEIMKYKVVYGRPNKVAQVIKDLRERNKEIDLFQKKKKK